MNLSVGIHVTDNTVTAIYQEPFGETGITCGKVIQSPLGKISVLFSHKNPIGRVLETPYLISEQRRLHHSAILKLSTYYEGTLFTDGEVCMLGLGTHLMVSLNPSYALDGDQARFDEDQQ